MSFLSVVLWFSLGLSVRDASASDWCYTGCGHTPSEWKHLPGSFCGENKQSPIDIDTTTVISDPGLVNFNFVKFSDQHVIKSIINDGHTVKYILKEDAVEVSGGGLSGTYSTLQFHFHWGEGENHPGSEHTVDGKRYPMEMHIVSLKKGLTADEAQQRPDGISVLGFFISEAEEGHVFEPWDTITSYLEKIAENEIEVEFTHNISISDLIGSVNPTKFYRYMGSLTTPTCNEAVVWTVFHEPISVKKDLIQRFSTKIKYYNVYRPTQKLNGRNVFVSDESLISHPWCYDEHCDHSPNQWVELSGSHCHGKHQSPINIDTKKVKLDENLKAFKFTNFADKHAISHIINTGHTVKCVLKDGVVEVSGGGMGHEYSTLQFHFHWATEKQDSKGSEHTVDSKKYPMEVHFVNKRKDLTLEEALNATDGLAVLGFFIEVLNPSESSSDTNPIAPHSSSTTSNMESEPWTKLTNYLSSIQKINSKVEFTDELSIEDLLGGVNLASYYRYNGSLTTPSCNEAVVWTVFKESIKVDHKLMMKFPKYAGYHNVYRPAQALHDRIIYTSQASSSVPGPVCLLLACLSVFFK